MIRARHFPPSTTQAALALALLLLPFAASAQQWQWLDRDGRRVFSDRPPPVDVPASRVLKQPRGAGAPPAAAAAAAPPAGSAPVAAARAAVATPPGPAGKDTELESRKKAADAAEAERQKAEQQRQQQARAENCQRAQQAQAGLNAGLGTVRMGADGQPVVLDDAARAAEQQRVQGVIAASCG